MYVVRVDGSGGSYFDTRKDAERELRIWGFVPSALIGVDFEKYLFTGKECRLMTATVRRES